MKVFTKSLALIFVLSISLKADPLMPFKGVQQVTQQDGDTIATSQVSVGVCPGTSCPTLLSSSQSGSNVTSKLNRKRCFVNQSSFSIFIGSNTTTLSTIGFLVTASTGSASVYCSYDTAAFYATASSTGTVGVIQETNGTP